MAKGFREAADKLKRFYKTVEVSQTPEGFRVLLDGRHVRTPRGDLMLAPTRALAELIAEEWAAQGDFVEIVHMHATRLANTAVAAVGTAREATAATVAQYAGSDLLCYFAEAPEALVARQTALWEPVLRRAEAELGLAFVRVAGIIHREQPAETLSRIEALAGDLDDFRLTGVAFGAALFGSGVLALALQRGWLSGEAALDLSRLDDLFQEEQWGVDEEAAERAARLRREAVTLDRWFRALDEDSSASG